MMKKDILASAEVVAACASEGAVTVGGQVALHVAGGGGVVSGAIGHALAASPGSFVDHRKFGCLSVWMHDQ